MRIVPAVYTGVIGFDVLDTGTVRAFLGVVAVTFLDYNLNHVLVSNTTHHTASCPYTPPRRLLLVLCFDGGAMAANVSPAVPRRAILKLRNMREEYAVALRQQHEGNAPSLSMFRSQVQPM